MIDLRLVMRRWMMEYVIVTVEHNGYRTWRYRQLTGISFLWNHH